MKLGLHYFLFKGIHSLTNKPVDVKIRDKISHVYNNFVLSDLSCFIIKVKYIPRNVFVKEFKKPSNPSGSPGSHANLPFPNTYLSMYAPALLYKLYILLACLWIYHPSSACIRMCYPVLIILGIIRNIQAVLKSNINECRNQVYSPLYLEAFESQVHGCYYKVADS